VTTTKQIPPIKFFELLMWLDGTPLVNHIEQYRRDILNDVLYSFDPDGRLTYNNILTGRGKKNWKTCDMLLAALYRLVAWKTTGGNDCYIVSFDLEQAGEVIDLGKKIVRINPVLRKALKITQDEIVRRDGGGSLKIISGRDIYGQHGKTFLFLGVNEVHVQRDYSLIEGLQLDPTRPDAMIWFESYDTLFRKPGVPIYDMMVRGKAGTDPRFYFSWYAGDYCSDPSFANIPQPERRANPSMGVPGSGLDMLYIEQQRQRLPHHIFRRLHLNQGGQPTGSAFAAEKIADAVARGIKVRPPVVGINYSAAADMSDGSSDDGVLSMGHRDEDKRAVVDLVMDQSCGVPFDPLKTVKLFAETMKQYHCSAVTLDRFAFNTFASAFSQYGISAMLSELTTHQTYEAFGPRLNSGQVVLLDNDKLENQFLGLVFRGAHIDHMPQEHDDYSAAVARLVNAMQGGALDLSLMKSFGDRIVKVNRGWLDQPGAYEPEQEGHFMDSLLSGRRFDW
jgi:hypothetical protein